MIIIIIIARFRVNSHKLRIETCRHETPKLPLENIICEKCTSNAIEDKMHCLLICCSSMTQRTQLITTSDVIPNFHNLDITEKF